jgi:hypothetical protein
MNCALTACLVAFRSPSSNSASLSPRQQAMYTPDGAVGVSADVRLGHWSNMGLAM